jgi:hypothetical protein
MKTKFFDVVSRDLNIFCCCTAVKSLPKVTLLNCVQVKNCWTISLYFYILYKGLVTFLLYMLVRIVFAKIVK